MTAPREPVIRGKRLELWPLSPEDVTATYVRWLNDPETVRFTEARHATHTLEGVRAYVASCAARGDDHLLGIFELAGGRHVGNIKIGPVNPHHQCASVGLIIGEKARWGRGYATEAIALAARYAFIVLGLHKLTAGVVEGNEASLRAFEKNGFHVEGVRRRQNYCEGRWRDEFMLGLLAEEWEHA
ncbi:MAG: GNAT family protein [Thermodesulfobacteriota bacterium]